VIQFFWKKNLEKIFKKNSGTELKYFDEKKLKEKILRKN